VRLMAWTIPPATRTAAHYPDYPIQALPQRANSP
jgi:hypothetical protein